MYRSAHQITFCFTGNLIAYTYLPGRASFFDARINKNPDVAFSVGPCDHVNCVRVPNLRPHNVDTLMRYLSGQLPHLSNHLLGLDRVIEQCLTLGVPIKVTAESVSRALDGFSPFDFALAHSERYKILLAPLYKGLVEETNRMTCTLPSWPPCTVLKRRKNSEASLDQVYDAVMSTCQIGSWLARLNLVRNLHPDTVALLEVHRVFEPAEHDELDTSEWLTRFAPTGACAGITLGELVGCDVLECFPHEAIVVGGALVHHIGGAELDSTLDLYLAEQGDVESLMDALACHGFVCHAPNSLVRGSLRFRVFSSSAACSAEALLATCGRDYDQIAWIPWKTKVVATLDCWRALLTRVSSVVVSGCTALAPGFTAARSLLDVGDNNTVWPCSPIESVADVCNPKLVTPLLFNHGSFLQFPDDISNEHGQFDNIISSLLPQRLRYEPLRIEPLSKSNFWGRFELSLNQNSWAVVSYIEQHISPLL